MRDGLVESCDRCSHGKYGSLVQEELRPYVHRLGLVKTMCCLVSPYGRLVTINWLEEKAGEYDSEMNDDAKAKSNPVAATANLADRRICVWWKIATGKLGLSQRSWSEAQATPLRQGAGDVDAFKRLCECIIQAPT